MKRTVRKNCFETNSSSIHAIVVNPSAELMIPRNNVIEFTLGAFGWELTQYTTIEDRASYLWTTILTMYEEFRDLDDVQYRTKDTLEWVDYITEVLDRNDIEAEFKWPEKPDLYRFYVDHVDWLDKWLDDLKNDKALLLAFLLGSDSEIRTGNDNVTDDRRVNTEPPESTWYSYVKAN